MSQSQKQTWVLILSLVVVRFLTYGLAEEVSNIESTIVSDPVVEVAPAVAAAPVVTPAAAPVQPAALLVAAPVQPASLPVAAPAPVVSSQQATIVTPHQGISGTTTEHKNPDGSIVTVTQFNGQLPQNAFHQPFPQMYNTFNPFYGHGPLFSSWGSPVYRSKRAIKEDKVTIDSKSSSSNFKPIIPKRPRISEKFHYPASPSEYFTTYKRPVVPVVDMELSDLI